jgi:hypothetical protein
MQTNGIHAQEGQAHLCTGDDELIPATPEQAEEGRATGRQVRGGPSRRGAGGAWLQGGAGRILGAASCITGRTKQEGSYSPLTAVHAATYRRHHMPHQSLTHHTPLQHSRRPIHFTSQSKTHRSLPLDALRAAGLCRIRVRNVRKGTLALAGNWSGDDVVRSRIGGGRGRSGVNRWSCTGGGRKMVMVDGGMGSRPSVCAPKCNVCARTAEREGRKGAEGGLLDDE